MNQPKNSLQLPRPTRNTRKITNKLMIDASGKINLHSKHNLVCHVVKLKAAMSAYSTADVIPCFTVFPFESSTSIN